MLPVVMGHMNMLCVVLFSAFMAFCPLCFSQEPARTFYYFSFFIKAGFQTDYMGKNKQNPEQPGQPEQHRSANGAHLCSRLLFVDKLRCHPGLQFAVLECN